MGDIREVTVEHIEESLLLFPQAQVAADFGTGIVGDDEAVGVDAVRRGAHP